MLRRWAGAHVVVEPRTGREIHYGLPPVAETPRMLLGTRGRSGKVLDIYWAKDFVVSERLKDLLSLHAPGTFETMACDAIGTDRQPLPPFWWLGVTNMLDDPVDDERSAFTLVTDPQGRVADGEVRYGNLNDILWRPDAVKDQHMFRLVRASRHVVVDETVADAIKRAGIKGAVLSPLQPPTKDDWRLPDRTGLTTYRYWVSKGYQA